MVNTRCGKPGVVQAGYLVLREGAREVEEGVWPGGSDWGRNIGEGEGAKWSEVGRRGGGGERERR